MHFVAYLADFVVFTYLLLLLPWYTKICLSSIDSYYVENEYVVPIAKLSS